MIRELWAALRPLSWRSKRGDQLAEWFRRGHDAGAAQAQAQLAGIVNLHRPAASPRPVDVVLCRTCSRPHPCPTYQLAGGPIT